jgi:plastocyanin
MKKSTRWFFIVCGIATVAAAGNFFDLLSALAVDDTYPVSRFGAPPPKVETGVVSGYTSREAESMDQDQAARAPASVQEPETDSVERRRGVQEYALIAGDLGYFPKKLFVNPDIPVKIYMTGASKNALCFMMDAFQVRKQVRSQKIEEITFTPNTPGKYRFYCPVNGMDGELVVRELSSSL